MAMGQGPDLETFVFFYVFIFFYFFIFFIRAIKKIKKIRGSVFYESGPPWGGGF